MRTTITVDNDIFEAAQAQARASGKKLGEVISQLARRGLRASADTASKNGLPVFKVERQQQTGQQQRRHNQKQTKSNEQLPEILRVRARAQRLRADRH